MVMEMLSCQKKLIRQLGSEETLKRIKMSNPLVSDANSSGRPLIYKVRHEYCFCFDLFFLFRIVRFRVSNKECNKYPPY